MESPKVYKVSHWLSEGRISHVSIPCNRPWHWARRDCCHNPRWLPQQACILMISHVFLPSCGCLFGSMLWVKMVVSTKESSKCDRQNPGWANRKGHQQVGPSFNSIRLLFTVRSAQAITGFILKILREREIDIVPMANPMVETMCKFEISEPLANKHGRLRLN